MQVKADVLFSASKKAKKEFRSNAFRVQVARHRPRRLKQVLVFEKVFLEIISFVFYGPNKKQTINVKWKGHKNKTRTAKKKDVERVLEMNNKYGKVR